MPHVTELKLHDVLIGKHYFANVPDPHMIAARETDPLAGKMRIRHSHYPARCGRSNSAHG